MDDFFEELRVNPKYDCKNSQAYREELVRIIKIKRDQAYEYYHDCKWDPEHILSAEYEYGRAIAFELVLDLLDGKRV